MSDKSGPLTLDAFRHARTLRRAVSPIRWRWVIGRNVEQEFLRVWRTIGAHASADPSAESPRFILGHPYRVSDDDGPDAVRLEEMNDT